MVTAKGEEFGEVSSGISFEGMATMIDVQECLGRRVTLQYPFVQ